MKKAVLLGLSAIGIGTAGYFLLRKSKAQLRKEIQNLAAPDNQRDIIQLSNILSRMTRQELLDMHRFFSMPITESNAEKFKSKLEPAFKARLIAISNKYNIFT